MFYFSSNYGAVRNAIANEIPTGLYLASNYVTIANMNPALIVMILKVGVPCGLQPALFSPVFLRNINTHI